MNTHISYETAKRLKDFLKESAPEPMANERWATHRRLPYKEWVENGYHTDDDFNFSFAPAYQLHDLLSKPFCEGLFPKFKGLPIGCQSGEVKHWHDIAIVICRVYINWGLPEVEKALTEMMEAK